MEQEQQVVPHKDAPTPETAVVPPGQSGQVQTDQVKTGQVKTDQVNKQEVNQPGQPVHLPDPSGKFDPRL